MVGVLDQLSFGSFWAICTQPVLRGASTAQATGASTARATGASTARATSRALGLQMMIMMDAKGQVVVV